MPPTHTPIEHIIGAAKYAKMEILDRALLAAGMEEFQR